VPGPAQYRLLIQIRLADPGRLTIPVPGCRLCKETTLHMRTIFALAGISCLLVANLFAAGTDYIIKQRAKELSNENNVRQGVAPPTAPTQPAAGAPRVAPPALSPSLVRFQNDLGTIGPGFTAAQKQALAQQLVAAAQGAKPSLTTSFRFVNELVAAWQEKALSSSSRSRLVQELDAVLNPGKYPAAKLDGIFNDIQAIFQENGAMRSRAVALADGVKGMSSEIQQGGAK